MNQGPAGVGPSSSNVWVDLNERKRVRATEDDQGEREKKRRCGDGDDVEADRDDEKTTPGKLTSFAQLW
jgi:hypothetical protein